MNSPSMNRRDFTARSNVINAQFNRQTDKANDIKALVPMRSAGATQPPLKLSRKALLLVVLVHVGVFVALVSATPIEEPARAPAKPMLVSLVANPAPEPEVVPLLPTPPKPEPVVKKQIKPKPVVQERVPEPQPVVAETPPPAPAEPAPAAITQEPQAVAKAPETVQEQMPVVEPKVEPPRFGAAYLENPAPAYPSQSRRLGEEGRVLLKVLVSENGDAETVQVDSGSGSSRLDRAALDAVKKWRFIPAKRDNQPISGYVIVPIKFSLES